MTKNQPSFLNSKVREYYLKFVFVLTLIGPCVIIGLIAFSSETRERFDSIDYLVILVGVSLFLAVNRLINLTLRNKIDVIRDENGESLRFLFKEKEIKIPRGTEVFEITIFGYITIGMISQTPKIFIVPKSTFFKFSIKIFWITKNLNNNSLIEISKCLHKKA